MIKLPSTLGNIRALTTTTHDNGGWEIALILRSTKFTKGFPVNLEYVPMNNVHMLCLEVLGEKIIATATPDGEKHEATIAIPSLTLALLKIFDLPLESRLTTSIAISEIENGKRFEFETTIGDKPVYLKLEKTKTTTVSDEGMIIETFVGAYGTYGEQPFGGCWTSTQKFELAFDADELLERLKGIAKTAL